MDKHLDPIRISDDDMQLFAACSHDRNPLHLDADFARRSPYGEPVVYGVLGLLAAIGRMPRPTGRRIARVVAEFRNPMVVGVDYQPELVDEDDARWVLTVRDGVRTMLLARLDLVEGVPGAWNPPASGCCSRTAAADRDGAGIAAGTAIEAAYAPDIDALRSLMDRWRLDGKGVGTLEASVLAWTSYFVGMEVPGRQAAYAKLDIAFPLLEAPASGPMSTSSTVAAFDTRYDLVRSHVSVTCGSAPVATGDLVAFLRRDLPLLTADDIGALMPPSAKLAGKVALVVGGSRGLGAALMRALASQGALVVLGYQRSSTEAERVAAECPLGSVSLLRADFSDVVECRTALRAMEREHGRVDLIVCNASPPIRPLTVEATSAERVATFVAESFALASVPMCVFLGAVDAAEGACVAISSQYAVTAPPDFPHYVAAKGAIESFVQALSPTFARTRFIVARPPKLLTDQTNTPMGRSGAIPPTIAACRIVEALLEADKPGVTTVDFI